MVFSSNKYNLNITATILFLQTFYLRSIESLSSLYVSRFSINWFVSHSWSILAAYFHGIPFTENGSV